MAVLSEQILEAAGKRPEGSLLAAKQFLGLGNRAAVDQALRRLAVRGKLVKIARGRYALPISSRFGTRPPAPEVVIAQLNREGAQQLVSSGAAAANALGLTTQMPVQQTFLARTLSQKRFPVAPSPRRPGKPGTHLAWPGPGHCGPADTPARAAASGVGCSGSAFIRR